jgi:hypothetical protein
VAFPGCSEILPSASIPKARCLQGNTGPVRSFNNGPEGLRAASYREPRFSGTTGNSLRAHFLLHLQIPSLRVQKPLAQTPRYLASGPMSTRQHTHARQRNPGSGPNSDTRMLKVGLPVSLTNLRPAPGANQLAEVLVAKCSVSGRKKPELLAANSLSDAADASWSRSARSAIPPRRPPVHRWGNVPVPIRA